MNWFRRLGWKLIRFFLFRVDAEDAHRFMVRMIRASITLDNIPIKITTGGSTGPETECDVLGLRFRSRVGLAAGFDKDAEILAALPDLGFGFAEIGTVTPRPQPGNDHPRLFRDPGRESLFNRMGFNGLGATLVSDRLTKIRPSLPLNFRVGVNIGKNKDTSLEDAALDYLKAIQAFKELADYVVINVSSPNTPGLRSLQNEESLRPIIEKVRDELLKWSKRPPLLLKIAPEITGEGLFGIIHASESAGIEGWVLTNTLGGQIELSAQKNEQKRLPGGWSGGALTEKARLSLQQVRSQTRLPIISVGGILSVEEAKLRMLMGADLIQIYSGWVYRGPGFPRELSEGLIQKS